MPRLVRFIFRCHLEVLQKLWLKYLLAAVMGVGLGSCGSALSAATIIHSITGPAVGPIQHSLTAACTVPPLPPVHFPRSSNTLSAHTVRLPCVFGQMTNCNSSSSSRSSRSCDSGREDSGGIKARRSRQMATGNGNGQGNLQWQLATATAAEMATEVDLNALQNAVKLF